MKRTNKLKGMYALLVAVAACVGITIYASCSADEDYDGYASKDELFTLADGEMEQGREGNGIITYISPQIQVSNKTFTFDDSTGTYPDMTLSFKYYLTTNNLNNTDSYHVIAFDCNDSQIKVKGSFARQYRYNSETQTYKYYLVFGAHLKSDPSIFCHAFDTVSIKKSDFTQNGL